MTLHAVSYRLRHPHTLTPLRVNFFKIVIYSSSLGTTNDHNPKIIRPAAIKKKKRKKVYDAMEAMAN